MTLSECLREHYPYDIDGRETPPKFRLRVLSGGKYQFTSEMRWGPGEDSLHRHRGHAPRRILERRMRRRRFPVVLR